MAFARATVILCSLVIWFSRKSLSWMVLFASLLDQFVSSFDRANGLWIFQFDAGWFIDFAFSKRFWSMGSVVLSLISENPRSRFMFQLMLLLCWYWVLKHVSWSQLLSLFNDGSDNTALLSWFLLKNRSVRILDTIVYSGSLVWLCSPAWDAVELTLPGGWLHLSFRGHRPYRIGGYDCSCSWTNAWQFPTYPRRRIPASLPFGIKA